MARAAVKAKQQAQAKAQPARARARGRRRHSGGGNPNQDLFFVRLRRHQRWVYAVLAVVFGLSFVLVGIGSGNGGGLSQLYTGLFGGGNTSNVSKAQAEAKKDPVKGYRDLALAYEQKGDVPQAINALQSYLRLKKDDAATWSQVGGLELSQGNTYATQYQTAQQAAQTADPSAAFLPGGGLGSAVGQNPTYTNAAQTASARTSLLYQKATSSFTGAVVDYQRASKLAPRNTTYLQELATAAQSAGNAPVELRALTRYLKLYPNAPLKKQIEKQIKALQTSSGTPSTQPGYRP
jgi:tetratricopeptide (TPR) repeat protein